MIKLTRFFVILTSLALAAIGANASDGVLCALDIYQTDSAEGKSVLLFTDTSDFLAGQAAAGFPLAFSLELEFTRADTAGCAFMVHVATLGPPVNSYSRRFQMEYGLPARMNGIEGKPGAVYELVITPLDYHEIDTSGCGYSHTRQGDFRVDPTGHLDIHFVETSYGDFFWNVIKGIMEERYRLFKSINNFTLPGKYQLYLAPCPMYSVIWDKRYGCMIDPTRSTMVALFNRDFNSADPFLVLQASAMRHYGYAPPLLADGFAGYLSFANYHMKKLVGSGRNLPLAELMDTYAFLQADPEVADATASSLVRYLVDAYKIDPFLQAYRRSHDLNLQSILETSYGKPIAELETEWLQYVDTISTGFDQFRYYADLAEAMFDYQSMREYQSQAYQVASGKIDSAKALIDLVKACFYTGDIYKAQEYQRQVVGADSSTAQQWVALAGYQMMNGYYDSAHVSLETARAMDSSNHLVTFNLGLNALGRGDSTAAKEFFGQVVFDEQGGGPQAESRVLLGHILLQSDVDADRQKADQYFREALNAYGQAIRSGVNTSIVNLWSGIAYLGIGDTGNAYDFLQGAVYFDTRPFYVGMANLWLGKTADSRGEHDAAKDFYGRVLAAGAAEYHQREARHLLDNPYQQ
jgi:tetratricopeptide (TPR) repeat protein